jgi:hypothetical protein
MKFVATMSEEDGRFIATCLEVDIAGEGSTKELALESLRRELDLYLHQSSAVAPPSHPDIEPVEVVLA